MLALLSLVLLCSKALNSSRTNFWLARTNFWLTRTLSRSKFKFLGGKFKSLRIMPRQYIKKGKNNQWSSAQLTAALSAVRSEGMSARGAARKSGIPSSTLHDHLTGKSQRIHSGAPTVLTASEEKEIEVSCQVSVQYTPQVFYHMLRPPQKSYTGPARIRFPTHKRVCRGGSSRLPEG